MTVFQLDSIVNAANIHLAHGSGVAGAVLHRGGEIIQQESDKVIHELGRDLETGEAVITTGIQLISII